MARGLTANIRRLILSAHGRACVISTCDLFETVHAEDSGGGYGGREVKSAAGPYVYYLKKIRSHYNDSSVSWKAVLVDSGDDKAAAGRNGRAGGGGGRTRQGPGTAMRTGRRRRRQQGGVPVSLEGLDEADLWRIAVEIESSGRVYEHGGSADRRPLGDPIMATGLDSDERVLWLERPPSKPHLRVAPSTYQLNAMIGALERVVHTPQRRHMPLRNFFRKMGGAAWPDVDAAPVDRWFFLGEDAEGVYEQRRFVRTALGTPDFAFLEGPPGSGKTTALCELVVQMAARGKRVLFCASTHVAVDNLLERLTGAGGEVTGRVAPIRIGTSEKISDEASRYTHDRFVATTEDRMRSGLSAASPRTRAQEMMLEVLRGGARGSIGRIALDHANPVCGTTIGILGHPDIADRATMQFDMMILDEASKTTLQEFLVPAVHADRWIIVGDTRQLVPHVDQDSIALQVGACMDEARKEACLDAFLAKKDGRTTVVAGPERDAELAYVEQCRRLGVRLRRPGDGGGPVGRGEVLIGPEKEVRRAAPRRQGVAWRGKGAGAAAKAAAAGRGGRRGGGEDTWESAVAWRISMHQPGKDGGGGGGAERLRGEVDMLVPQDDDDGDDAVRAQIDTVRRIALPSVLELAQHGFSADRGGDGGGGDTLLERGMPKEDFEKRHVLLEWQHRMHPDIAAFPHRHMYEGRALKTPGGMASRRAWQYRRYSSRAVWIDVPAGGIGAARSPSNRGEADCAAREVAKFVEFAKGNPRPGGGPWEVAVLSFYTGQMGLLRERLRRVLPHGGQYTLRLPAERPRVLARIRTVDSFQGHEADLVVLSTVNSHPTPFLRNPNRLNVALTRARYQCVVVGDRGAMSRDPLLGALAEEMDHWTGVQ